MDQFSSLCRRIGGCAVQAMLHEVSAAPKPGLVDPVSNGAHRDMDLFTFIDSAVAIGPFLTRMAEIACSWGEELPDDALPQLRRPGLDAEAAMFAATGGVNTHKGAIFSMGLLCAAAARCWKLCHHMEPLSLCTIAAEIALDVDRDFARRTEGPLTNGEAIFRDHNIRGARGEAAGGFASVRTYGLPVLRAARAAGYPRNTAYLQTLLSLMANVVDTNIIARRGLKALEEVRTEAAALLEQGGAATSTGLDALRQMDREFIEKNISPGGCADLLAVTILLDHLEELGHTLAKEAEAL